LVQPISEEELQHHNNKSTDKKNVLRCHQKQLHDIKCCNIKITAIDRA